MLRLKDENLAQELGNMSSQFTSQIAAVHQVTALKSCFLQIDALHLHMLEPLDIYVPGIMLGSTCVQQLLASCCRMVLSVHLSPSDTACHSCLPDLSFQVERAAAQVEVAKVKMELDAYKVSGSGDVTLGRQLQLHQTSRQRPGAWRHGFGTAACQAKDDHLLLAHAGAVGVCLWKEIPHCQQGSSCSSELDTQCRAGTATNTALACYSQFRFGTA
jgi:hypothetical protein